MIRYKKTIPCDFNGREPREYEMTAQNLDVFNDSYIKQSRPQKIQVTY